jgi:hypothetical protein
MLLVDVTSVNLLYLQYEGVVVFAAIEDFRQVILDLLDDDELRLGIQLNALAYAHQFAGNVSALHSGIYSALAAMQRPSNDILSSRI